MPNTLRHAVATLILLSAAGTVRADEVLLGRVTPESILSISPEWRANHDAYEPDPGDVQRLSSSPVAARLDIYFGSWCSDSRREVPRLLKILDHAASRNLKVRFYGLDRSKKEPARLVKRGAIERVPTLILKVRGREIGRIVETPRTSLEHDLALLIERAAAPPPGGPS
jgi:hypothetical protein